MNDAQLAAYLFNERRPILYLQDPGHGWFSVKRAALDALGVLDRVSSYSYQRGASVYLEEDCDASLLFNAVRERFGRHPVYESRHTDRVHPIRSYLHFRAK